jgi:hypothetical protein
MLVAEVYARHDCVFAQVVMGQAVMLEMKDADRRLALSMLTPDERSIAGTSTCVSRVAFAVRDTLTDAHACRAIPGRQGHTREHRGDAVALLQCEFGSGADQAMSLTRPCLDASRTYPQTRHLTAMESSDRQLRRRCPARR